MTFEKSSPFEICNTQIQPGERLTLALPTPEIYTCAPAYIPIHIIHGKKKGPCLLVCAAIHGDEVNGVSIIQRLLEFKLLKKIQGTLIAVPVINIYGLITQSRNLVDRRDLEHAFPGLEAGSFAARLAFLFSREIIKKATHCIDIHTGEPYYFKLPQTFTNTSNLESLSMARSFQAPVITHTTSRRGMLWALEEQPPIPTLIYEGGEAYRLNDLVIKMGIKGILRVMRDLNMLRLSSKSQKGVDSMIIRSSVSVRAPGSGICQLEKKIGEHVHKEETIAIISDPFGTGQQYSVFAPIDGVVTALNYSSLINEGDILFEIAKTKEIDEQWKEIDHFEEVNY